ncbi:MAG: CHAP domain-containing protein [Bifidobacteriaceae bacterium]|jgi:hypothetical protein|nr:CHAP domain-containing protein [Bifidobacteriaceae bacterium]
MAAPITLAVGQLGQQAKKYITYWGRSKPEAWCADFAGWCVDQAGHTLARPFWGNVDNMASQLVKKGWGKSSIPRAGDVFINPATHTGLVEKVASGRITTIEGNTQGLDNWTAETVRRITRASWSGYYFLTPPTAAATPPASPTPAKPGRPAPGPKVAFPLPSGHYYGPREGPDQSVSGRVKRKDGLTGAGMNVWAGQLIKRGWGIGKGRRYLTVYGLDGQYGNEWKALITAFQKDQGVSPTGRLDKATWDAAYNNDIT